MDWFISFISSEIGFDVLLYILLPVFILLIITCYAGYQTHKNHLARMEKIKQGNFSP